MQRISSKLTFVYKHVMPWTCIVYAIAFPLVCFVAGIAPNLTTRIMIAALGVVGCVIGFIFVKFMMRNVVDEVLDEGEALRVRNKGSEFRIPVRDCVNVNYVPHISPTQISIMLRPNCEHGESLVFMAPVQFNPLTESPFVRDLTLRIDAARRLADDHHEPIAVSQ